VSRLLLFAAVVLGPPLLWAVVLLVRDRLITRKQARVDDRTRVTVAELQARLEHERAEQTDDLWKQTRLLARQTGLPHGWVWPERDWDAGEPRFTPPRPRPYARRLRERAERAGLPHV
jgi:hypothetical protein